MTRVIAREDLEAAIAEGKEYKEILEQFKISQPILRNYCLRNYGMNFKKLRSKIRKEGVMNKEVEVKRKRERLVKYLIDKKVFEKLCALQCTKAEILGFLEVPNNYLNSWCEEIYGKPYMEVYEEKRQSGLVSLRRNQMKLSERSSTMAIFLGKNYLNQQDKTSIETSNNNSNNALSELTEEELREILNISKNKDIEIEKE